MYSPQYRPRRLRASETIRRMVRETKLSPDDFIYPLFVTHGKGVKKEISSMPGNYQQSIENLVKDCEEIHGARHPGGDPLRHPGAQGRTGHRGLFRRGHRPARHQGHQEQAARTSS